MKHSTGPLSPDDIERFDKLFHAYPVRTQSP